MPTFRKKPVEIQAEQFWPDKMPWPEGVEEDSVEPGRRWIVYTLEGEHTASPGDFIITGVKGERYPCKPDIFLATYEPVGDEAAEAYRIASEPR